MHDVHEDIHDHLRRHARHDDGHHMRHRHKDRDRERHGHHPRGARRGERRGDRTQRGDVRAAILLLLDESPMHGYQLMQEIDSRTEGAWRPSPGAVYPTIALLEDEGLVTLAREGSRQLVTLTDSGRAHVEAERERFGDPFTPRVRDGALELRDLFESLHQAVFQVARGGSDSQIAAARTAITETRRRIYLILADGEPAATADAANSPENGTPAP